MIGRGFGAFRARLADRRARLPLGFQMMLGVGGLLALSVLASIAAAVVVVGVGHAARNDERGVPYRYAVDVAALNAKGIANDERGYLLSGDPTFIAEARERTGLARAALDNAVRSATTAEEATAARTVSQGFEAWVSAVQRGFADYSAGRQSQAVAASIGPSRELRKTYEDRLARAQSLADSSEHAATTSLTRLIHDSLAILVISLAIVLAIGLCLSFWLVRSVALPVYRIAEILGPGPPATDPGNI
jgi:methyl-accepting chemotaxis protein